MWYFVTFTEGENGKWAKGKVNLNRNKMRNNEVALQIFIGSFFQDKGQLGRNWYKKLKVWEQKLARSEAGNGLLRKKNILKITEDKFWSTLKVKGKSLCAKFNEREDKRKIWTRDKSLEKVENLKILPVGHL